MTLGVRPDLETPTIIPISLPGGTDSSPSLTRYQHLGHLFMLNTTRLMVAPMDVGAAYVY